ncbi:MAG: nucleoside-diphosphate sugar epimerase/dehydratase [Coriobacteriia bacterium]|jgi:FlaA1/EpsC-like NDP-sugar epimerase|nr:nucleoside-diphosphate sugar epimerase/dehydratase [Coriobacteriia bacterium]
MLTFIVLDVVIVWVSTLLAYWARFGGSVTPEFLGNVSGVALVAGVVFPVVFYALGLYHHVWRYVGVDMVIKLALGVVVGLGIMSVGVLLLTEPRQLRPVPLGALLIMSAFIFIGSASLRSFGRLLAYFQTQSRSPSARNILIVGAGDAGSLLLRDVENQPDLLMRVVGFIDDDTSIANRIIRGVRVLGTVSDIPTLVRKRDIDEVLVAVPSASTSQRRRILDECTQAGVKTRIIESMALEKSSVGVADLRKVDVEDLLGREPVPIDVEQVGSTIRNKVIAVTGAAGSIGSELCRQVMTLGPSRLLLLDIDESRTYEMFLELRRIDRDVPQMHICDVRDARKVAELIESERPSIVLHAAAYKHVPLMELEPDEAIKANVWGTQNVIEACEVAGVEHFVLISTDKAVMPSSVMGATKALAEMLTIHASQRGLIKATAVRFGNVLGSRGSVIPIFEEQLRKGGPLLVTHPEITRYFMTIPEAARLVLQAQAISDGGELFVLEMGEPVRIVDLARKMITLSGTDVGIEFIGLRPAEKLHETLVHSGQDLLATDREKILRVNALTLLPSDLDERVDTLIEVARSGDREGSVQLLERLLPDFHHGDAAGSEQLV